MFTAKITNWVILQPAYRYVFSHRSRETILCIQARNSRNVILLTVCKRLLFKLPEGAISSVFIKGGHTREGVTDACAKNLGGLMCMQEVY